jgi:hypothetical protein
VPDEQVTRFELVVYLRTAKALGLTIPRSVLERANEVIAASCEHAAGTWHDLERKLGLMRYCGMPSTAKVRYLAYFSPIFRTCSYAGSFRHARTASTLGYS